VEIVAHYLRQLDSAGWKTGAPVISGNTALASTEAPGTDGVRWSGAIVASRIRPMEVDVVIRMSRPRER